ncbi:MAG: hypothetical protein ACYC96_09920 [Fimbriimonadaceae bacterium]
MKLDVILRSWKPVSACLFAFALGAGSSAQFGGGIKDLLKIGGVGLAVTKFGPQINKEMNKVAHTPDVPPGSVSKVVPILSGGLNSRKAIGAAQVRGVRSAVNRVNAVAQVNQDFLGVFKLTVYIPIASKDVIKNLQPVAGVGVTGVVDLKL